MSSYIIWWIMAALLVGVELATGTFYLLAVGAAFAGLAKEGNTLIVPSNMSDLASLVTTATMVLKATKQE